MLSSTDCLTTWWIYISLRLVSPTRQSIMLAILKRQQNQVRSCKTIITYMMTRKSTPTIWKYQKTLALSLTRANPLPNKLPNHISEAFLVTRSKYKNILWTVSLEGGGGGGGEIPEGGRAGRARFGQGFGPGRGKITGGGGGGEWGEIPGTPEICA